MSDTGQLLTSVKVGEGYRANPYPDSVGIWTVGYGANLEANPFTSAQWRYLLAKGHLALSLSQAGAEYLMSATLAAIERRCAMTWPWFTQLNDARQNVLIEAAYNLGLPKLLMFVKMLDALAGGDFETAAREGLNSKWATQIGDRAVRLMTQLRTGSFP